VNVADLPLTMTIEEAGKLLGVSRGLAYEAARRGGLPTISLGRRLLVPRARLLELLGEPSPNSAKPALAGSEASRDSSNENPTRRLRRV
jgi:excisionase family DNA binding protein